MKRWIVHHHRKSVSLSYLVLLPSADFSRNMFLPVADITHATILLFSLARFALGRLNSPR